jgi:hypothetical protein
LAFVAGSHWRVSWIQILAWEYSLRAFPTGNLRPEAHMQVILTVALTVDVPKGPELESLSLGLPTDQIEGFSLPPGHRE